MSLTIINARLGSSEETYSIEIRGGVIEDIVLGASGGDELIDAGGRLVSPGLVDPHMHLDKAFLSERYANRTGTLEEAIRVMGEAKRRFTVESVAQRAGRLVEMASAHGTTLIRTHVDVDTIVGLTGLEALLGVREAYRGRVDLQIVAFPQEGLEQEGAVSLLEDALEMGADAVGGIPALDEDPEAHIDTVFELSGRHSVDVDMHIDESESPDDLTLEYYADKASSVHGDARMVASHCCSLSVVEDEKAAQVIDKVREAGIGVVTLPSTNLYLLGRNGYPKTRGLTRVRQLLDAGVQVLYGSDNVRDPFNPFGNANLLEIGCILAHADHMGGGEELRRVFSMASERPKTLLRDDRGLFVGSRADLVVHDALDPIDAVVSHRRPLCVIKDGSIVSLDGRQAPEPVMKSSK